MVVGNFLAKQNLTVLRRAIAVQSPWVCSLSRRSGFMIDRIILSRELYWGSHGAIYYKKECSLRSLGGIVLKSERRSHNSLSKIDRIQPFPKVEDVTSLPLTVLRDELRRFPTSLTKILVWLLEEWAAAQLFI